MSEVTDVVCLSCGLPAFREGLTFWCPGCDKSVEITVPGQ